MRSMLPQPHRSGPLGRIVRERQATTKTRETITPAGSACNQAKAHDACAAEAGLRTKTPPEQAETDLATKVKAPRKNANRNAFKNLAKALSNNCERDATKTETKP